MLVERRVNILGRGGGAAGVLVDIIVAAGELMLLIVGGLGLLVDIIVGAGELMWIMGGAG